jgi:hypothetical protein
MNADEMTSWIISRAPYAVQGFALRQQTGVPGVDETASPVAEYPPLPSNDADGVARQLAIRILSDAQTDADDTGGACKYVVIALNEARKTSARKAFRLHGDRLGEDAAPAEPPSLTGHMAQMMRHLEAMARQSLAERTHTAILLQSMTGMMQSQLDRAARRITELEEREHTVITEREKLAGDSHARAIEIRKLDAELAIRGQAIQKIAPLATLLAHKALKLPLAGAATPGTPAVKALLESLSEEQQTQLFGLMKPEQHALLASLIQDLQAPSAPKTE